MLGREAFRKMSMCLAMETADGGERRFPINQVRLVLGRDTRCDLRVSVPSVSDQHCEIVVDGNILRLNDLGSLTGTFHNGVRVTHAVLAVDDRVTIGPVTFVVRGERRADPPGTVAELKPQPRKEKTRPAAASSSRRMSCDN
jgi:pSer/pThr/pTyr-binding forkhead associated (FHA) protein